MDGFGQGFRTIFLFILCFHKSVTGYNTKDHPCCSDPPPDNLTLAMVLDPNEIYGHDQADKLDHLLHYQMEMYKITNETDQTVINEHVHIATDHLERFVHLHTKELKVLMIALDDLIDNMVTMYDNHNAIKTERVQNLNSGAVPIEFYMSQEFYCGKNVYIFISELYSDIYHMGRGMTPYCRGKAFYFLGFVHHLEEDKYYLEDDEDVAFNMDDYRQGLECHTEVCIYRFPEIRNIQHVRDIVSLPKSVTKCGLVTYKLPPVSEASCVVSSGSFIFDFTIQGVKYRHHDFLLILPNGETYYTKEENSPIACHFDVCEWKYTNPWGGPLVTPGEPEAPLPPPIPPMVDTTEAPPINDTSFYPTSASASGCWYMFPPNYGSIAGVSYLDPLSVHDYRYSCQGMGTGLYWYPRPNVMPPRSGQYYKAPQE